jgi:TOMM system kinase/cyclase fusion protein
MQQHDLMAAGLMFEGRYELLAKLGEGGFGTVFKARQRATGQTVALKVMRSPERGGATRADTRVARFLREARICAGLHHPNIVHVVESGQTGDGSLFTSFAFAPGVNLADLLAREGALAPAEARHLMLQVLDALACAHKQGVIHRDLKPSNIMVIPTGARRNALVLDFGIGAIIENKPGEARTPLTGSNDTLGTPGYGAPEQWRGVEPSPRADLFAWGLVFLECLTGRPVYGAGTAAEIFYQQLGPAPVPIPAALERHPLGDILRKATLKDVALRDVTAAGLLEALEACDLRGLSRDAILDIGGCPIGPAGRSRPPSLLTEANGAFFNGQGALELTAVAGERRQLTAMCCHLRASAGALAGLDVEDHDDVLRAAIAVCARVAGSHNGRVISALGDELLVYFGYPRAEEDDTRRAARAALAIARAAREESERLVARGVGIEVGIGVHTGLVVAGEIVGAAGASVAVGATPRLAARLASLAPAGWVTVTAETHRLLRASFELEANGTRDIEGIAAPVEIFRLHQERAGQTPGLTPDGSKAPLVGRDHEIELLLERWRRVSAGAGQCSLVTGEPGIGKSRLARELRDRMAKEAHLFIEGRCSPDTQNSALFPVVELLGRALGLEQEREPRGKVARLEAKLGGYGFSLTEAMPLFSPLFSLPLDARYVPLDVSSQRQKTLTLNAIASLLFTMAERTPVVLLVEDLHWADATTLELLAQLVREAPSAPMCILMTARPEFSPAFSTSGMLQLPLGRLDRPQIEAMVMELVGRKTLPPAFIDQVVSRADGIPLFVEELTRMMLESGILVERGGGYELSGRLSDLEIPGTLRALLTVRLDRLERAKETAQLAAALGREFSVEVLSAASPLGPAAVQEDLDKLTAAGLVLRKRRPKDAVAIFKHALVRDAAYESLSRGAKQRAHARIAATLGECFPEVARARPDLLAHHHAAADQKEQAIVYADKASQQALQRSAYAEAMAHASNVVQWVGALPPVEGAEVELAANGVLTQAMMAFRGWADPQVKATVDRSAALLQTLDRTSAHKVPHLWFLFTYHHVASNRRAARVVAEELVAIAEGSGDQGLRAAAATLHGIALFVDGDHAAAREALERAIGLYDPNLHRDHGARFGLDSLVMARTLLAQLRWFSGDGESASQLVTTALEWAREVGHVPSIAIGLVYGCMVYQLAGDKPAVASMTGEVLSLAGRYGLPAYEGYAAIVHGWATGDEQHVQAILDGLAYMGCKLSLSYFSSLRADTLAERGRLDEAIACIDGCLLFCRENDEHYYEPELYRRRAMYQLRRVPSGDEQARASLEEAARLARRHDLPRIEAQATLELLRRFDGDGGRRARVDELYARCPGLRALEVNN